MICMQPVRYCNEHCCGVLFWKQASSSRLFVSAGLCLFSLKEMKEKPPTGLCKRSWSAFLFPITSNLLTEPFLFFSLTPLRAPPLFSSTQTHRQSSLWIRKLVPMKPFLFGCDWVQPSRPGCHTAPLALRHGRGRLLVSPPNCGQQLKSCGSAHGTGQASSDSSFLRLVKVLSRLCFAGTWLGSGSLVPWCFWQKGHSLSLLHFSTDNMNLSLVFFIGVHDMLPKAQATEKIRCFYLSGTLSADCCGCLLSLFSPADLFSSVCPMLVWKVCGLKGTLFRFDCI